MRPRLADAALSELTLCQYTVLMRMQRGISARQADALSVHCTDERGCKPPEFMHPIDLAVFYKIYSGFQHTMKENRKLMER